jgi:hypothetical protein
MTDNAEIFSQHICALHLCHDRHALVASGMTFFYDVARRMRHPSWGVTANLCVVLRTNNTVWFSSVYPKTGGGEDVDFCLRLKALLPHCDRASAIVAVPDAVVLHPFWNDIFKQVMGWAKGDTLCLEQLPHNTFCTLPNWIEWMLFISLAHILPAVRSMSLPLLSLLAVPSLVEVAMLVPNVLVKTPSHFNHPKRFLLALLAVGPAMAQDAVRLLTKLRRGKLHLLCTQFDWMDGQRGHVTATIFSQFVKKYTRSSLLLDFSNANYLAHLLSPLA